MKQKCFEGLPNLCFCYELQLFRLEMEYYFMHIAVVGSLTLPLSIAAIFVHSFWCMGPYVGNGITNVGLQMLNCLPFVGITFFFNGASLKII